MRRLLPLLCLTTGCKLFVDPSIPETCEDLGTCDGDTDTDTDTTPTDADADGYSLADGDCNDGDADINPGAPEVCDDGGVDENCDGLVNDEDPAVTGTVSMYADADGDGWGGPEDGAACRPTAGQTERGGDCDDGDDAVNPDAEEVCNNGRDDDCDGSPGECYPYEGSVGRGFANPAVITDGPDAYFGLWAAAADLTGDGTDDLVLSGPTGEGNSGFARVYAGLEAGMSRHAADAQASVKGDEEAYLGVGLATGDLDGDGLSDLVVLDTLDAALVFRGPLSGDLGPEAAWLRIQGIETRSIEYSRIAAVDLDGDGIDELHLGASGAGASPDRGAVYVFDGPHPSGRIDGPGEASRRLFGADDTVPGDTLTTGDFDGDGVADLVTSDPYADTSVERGGLVWVLRDSLPMGDSTVADVTDGLVGTRQRGIAGIGLAAGDLDGDGTDDLVVAAPGSGTSSGGRVFIFDGAPEGIRAMTVARTTILQPTPDTSIGILLSVGDLSGDGAPDLALSEPGIDSDRGAIHMLYGPLANGHVPVSAVDATVRGTATGSQYGLGLDAVGDLDGDGSDDLVVGANINAVDVLFGGGW